MSHLLSIGAWYFVPNLVTGWLQSLYYSVTIRAGDPLPQPGHPRFEKHKRNIFVFVIISYLLYTIYEVDWELQRQGDFYRDLGVGFEASEKSIQSRFRRLTVIFHPDKLQNPTPEQLMHAQNVYVHLKNARDTLVNPSKRFAYERFGPVMLDWKDTSTKLDFFKLGMKQGVLPYYLFSTLTLVTMGLFGYSEYGRYWQYFSIACMLVLETYTISRPDFPIFLTNILNPILLRLGNRQPYMPYQAILVSRRIAISIFIAVSQIAPRLVAPQSSMNSRQGQQLSMNRLTSLVQNTNKDVDLLLRLETVPFFNDDELESRLKREMKSWALQNQIRNDPGVDQAIRRVLSSRMAGQERDEEDQLL